MISFLFVLLSIFRCHAKFDLGNTYSLSGISAGGYMATQFQFAFSDEVTGVASFAAGPFYCAGVGGIVAATSFCMTNPWLVSLPALYTEIAILESSGLIAATSNLRNKRAFIYHGALDVIVNQKLSFDLEQMYLFYGLKNITTKFSILSGHGVPTLSYGVTCPLTASPYINSCGYDGVGAAFTHILDNVRAPAAKLNPRLTLLQTAQFMPKGWTPKAASLADAMIYYAPKQCYSKACKLHIALHGCDQDPSLIGTQFLTDTGYLEYAETNDLVILAPATINSFLFPLNPQGCFDWWGYTDGYYATRKSVQMNAIRNAAIFLGLNVTKLM